MSATLYDWAGGAAAFERLIDAFCDRIEADELLAPLAGGRVADEHRERVVAYVESGTRLALHNAQPGADIDEHAPVPRRGRGEAPPYQP